MKLWIDDERPPPQGYRLFAWTSDDAIDLLERFAEDAIILKTISFDHDLGGNDTSRRVMMWMIENEYWPEEVRIHTANPVGREWLVGTAKRYAPSWVVVDGEDHDAIGFENYG